MFNLLGVAIVFLIVSAGFALIAAPVAFCGALLGAGLMQWQWQQLTSRNSLILCSLLGGVVAAAIISVWTTINPWLLGAAVAFVAGAIAVPMKVIYHSVTGSKAN